MEYTTIELKIPKGQRLGQAIMNAYRDQWQPEAINLDTLKHNWDGLTQKGKDNYKDIQGYIDYRMENKYWNIWELDQGQIQKKIIEMYN